MCTTCVADLGSSLETEVPLVLDSHAPAIQEADLRVLHLAKDVRDALRVVALPPAEHPRQVISRPQREDSHLRLTLGGGGR